MNTNFLKRLDLDTLEKINNAQMDDLIERRKIRDPELFKLCFALECSHDHTYFDDISNFSTIAEAAFRDYHARRAAAAQTVEAENDEAENDEAENDEAENDEAENDEAENDEAENDEADADEEDADEEDAVPTF